MLVSGSINAPGSPQDPDEGGVYLDNTATPGSTHLFQISMIPLLTGIGCEKPNVNCYPLKWKTIFELYEDAGVSWQVYQGEDNFDDNPLAWFQQYQTARRGNPLADKGMAFPGLDKFYKDAADGTLPRVSFIVGPRELSEHSPYSPRDGAWLQEKIVEAVTKGPKYGQSVLMISFDGNYILPIFHLTILPLSNPIPRIRRMGRPRPPLPLPAQHPRRMGRRLPRHLRPYLHGPRFPRTLLHHLPLDPRGARLHGTRRPYVADSVY